MATATDPIVLCDGVRKVYEPSPRWLRLLAKSAISEPVTALDRIDLVLEPGTICAVVGPNGAGKTTMFRVLAGLTTADAGTVRVGGLDPDDDGRRVRGMIGWMPTERRSLFLRQTTFQNLAFHGRLRGIPEAELGSRIDEVLEVVGLGGKKKVAPQAFSDGMRARLLLARALLARPRLLLLDEPTGPVDPVAAHQLLELVQRLVREQGIAALISSHRLEEIAALDGRVHLIDRGRTIFDGDLGELRRRRSRLVLTFTNPESAARAGSTLAEDHPSITAVGDAALAIEGSPDVGAVLAALGRDVRDLVHVEETAQSLRELLAELYDGGTP